MATTYEKHIKGFGSPEAYAQAIKQAEASGRSLSDPQAAAEFQKAYPQYFTQPKPYEQHIKGFGSPQAYAQAILKAQAAGRPLSDPAAAAAFQKDYPELFPLTPGQRKEQLTQPLPAGQYQFPYEQYLRDVAGKSPEYRMPTQSELLQQATAYAQIQTQPQQEALQRALEQTVRDAEAQAERIRAAYAGVPEQATRQLQEAERRALLSAIARGGGRSGAVEWGTAELSKPIMEQFTQAQAQQAAELAAIANQIALAQRQAQQQAQQLAEQQGRLTTQQLGALQDIAFQRAMGSSQWQADLASRLAQMALGAQQWQQQYAAGLLPYYSLTEAQRQQIPLDWTQLIGVVPKGY